jgi:hypothetical protein
MRGQGGAVSGLLLECFIFWPVSGMALMHDLWLWIDRFLILPYRVPGNPMIGFFLGTFVLALWCALIGELTLAALWLINRSHLGSLRRETVAMHNLSLKAILSRDKESYTACNKQANEAFGRYFFAQVGLGAAALWPLFFALAWMQTRFAEVTFPLAYPLNMLTPAVGYVFVLFLCYLLARILLKNLRGHLPMLRKVHASLKEKTGVNEEQMMTFADIIREDKS